MAKITVKQAAEILNRTPASVRYLIKQGHLSATRHENIKESFAGGPRFWYTLNRAEVEELKEQAGGAGRLYFGRKERADKKDTKSIYIPLDSGLDKLTTGERGKVLWDFCLLTQADPEAARRRIEEINRASPLIDFPARNARVDLSRSQVKAVSRMVKPFYRAILINYYSRLKEKEANYSP